MDGRAPARLAKTDLILFPIKAMAAMDTSMIRANITAYSVTVGPFSLLKKVRILLANIVINNSLLNSVLST